MIQDFYNFCFTYYFVYVNIYILAGSWQGFVHNAGWEIIFGNLRHFISSFFLFLEFQTFLGAASSAYLFVCLFVRFIVSQFVCLLVYLFQTMCDIFRHIDLFYWDSVGKAGKGLGYFKILLLLLLLLVFIRNCVPFHFYINFHFIKHMYLFLRTNLK